MKYVIEEEGVTGKGAEVVIERTSEGHFRCCVEGREYLLDVRALSPQRLSLIEQKSLRVIDALLQVQGDESEVTALWQSKRFKVLDARKAAARLHSAAAASQKSWILRAPMPGRVVKLLVAPGDSVTRGQSLMMMEAMKMENELKAPGDGVIGKIHIQTGQTVEANATLMESLPV